MKSGFILLETLISVSLIFLVVFTVVPIVTTVNTERQILKERILVTSMLHDEIQEIFTSDYNSLPQPYEKDFKEIILSFSFTRVEQHIFKGCVEWINKKNMLEEVCLYGAF